MSNFFVALAVFLITIIGSLFAIPYFVDWNSYRGVFEDEATRFLGREVRVGGAVNLHLLPVPSVRLERVRIGDVSGNLREPFFRADSLAFKLSIAPLFRGVIEANEIEFRRPVLRLAREGRGSWNWQSFGQVFANAAYLPSNVALTSLKISDGILAVHAPGGAERLRLEAIEGELSAPAIDGPYRFRGSFGKRGAEREIRLATSRPDGESGVRLRTSIRLADSGAAYLVDARLLDLMAEPKLEGELSARLPILGPAPAAPRRALGAAEEREPSELAFDLKANLRADADGGSLSDLALSFEQDGRPQLLVGEAKANWQDALALDVELSARWLDLDRLSGAGEGARPSQSLIPLTLRARELLPATGRSRLALSVDQANLGGEAISGVHLAVARDKDTLSIEQLRVAMPGGSRAELKGAVRGPAEAPDFKGELSLRGASFMRALAWASKSPAVGEAKGDGAFGLFAELTVAPGRALARNIVGDLMGTPLAGEADWRWQGRPEMALRLEAPQLDLRALAPLKASLTEGLAGMLQAPAPELTGARAGKRAEEDLPDLRLSLDAGRLISTAAIYKDVALEVRLKAGNLEVPRLRLADDNGLLIDLKGALENVLTRPKGSLSGVVAAASAADLAGLADLLGAPETWRPDARLGRALAPLRLAGSLIFGQRSPTSRDLTLAGEVNGANLKATARFEGAAADWRSGTAEVVASVDAADSRKLVALILDRDEVTAKATPGQVLLKAKGVPAEGIAAVLSLAAGDLSLDFQGQLALPEKGKRIAGDLRLKAVDGERLAALAGLSPPLQFAGVPIEGALKLTADAEAITLQGLGLNIGGTEVRGKLHLAHAGERRHVEARLDLGETGVRALLAPLLDQRLAAITGAAEAAIAGRQSPWPDEPFDLSGLAAIDGHVVLGLDRLNLSEGIGLKDATIDVVLQDGKVNRAAIEAPALGGRGRLEFSLAGSSNGAEVNGSLHLADGRLEAVAGLASASKAGTTGRINADLSFSGRGANLRNLLTALQGQGRAQLEGKLAGLWPGAIGLAAEQVFKNDPERLKRVLKEALTQGLSVARLPLPDEVALEIGEGQLRSRAIAIDTAQERAAGSAAIGLLNLVFDSEWRLEQSRSPENALGGKKVLPALSINYRGPLAQLDKLEPVINSEALERELAVRKMEHDVEELERLRQLDEARRRSEAERMRQDVQTPPAPVPTPVAPVTPARPATPG